MFWSINITPQRVSGLSKQPRLHLKPIKSIPPQKIDYTKNTKYNKLNKQPQEKVRYNHQFVVEYRRCGREYASS